MKFINDPYQKGETVAAIATAPGEAAIAIVRLCGDRALAIADEVFSARVSAFKSHSAHLGKIIDEKGHTIDQALLIPMLGKRSFCGEDTVEFHCHGGNFIAKEVLSLLLRKGAKAAKPGEFSFKAFINQKMDLAQAEAIQEMIGAQNKQFLKSAEEQLEGRLSKQIANFQKSMTRISAMLNAWVDFPEEDLSFAPLKDVCQDLEEICRSMQELIASFEDGRLLREGAKICLLGSPNVGKSSLMNALLNKEKAIVTEIAGTTRDLIEDSLRLGQWQLQLCDTAGIRQASDIIEEEGIRRSKKAIEDADLILWVLDQSKGLEDPSLIEIIDPKKTLLVWNKIDQSKDSQIPNLQLQTLGQIAISVKEGTGIDDLQKLLLEILSRKVKVCEKDLVLTSFRHKLALEAALSSCKMLLEGCQKERSPEFLCEDARACLKELGKIIGKDIDEEVLHSIFSQFCIGK